MSFLFTKIKMVRYLISGGTAAVVFLGLLYLLTDIFGIWYLLSSTLSFIFAFVVSFTLQKLWTFRNTHVYDIKRQLFLYFVTALAGLSANAIFMYVLVDIAGLWYIFAQVLSSGTIAIITFFVYGNIIFYHAQKNNILIATPLYPPDIGGPATYTRLLETELPKHNIKTIIASFGSVRSLPKIVRHIVYFLYLLVLSIETKTMYALDPVSVGFPALIASKLTRKRFLLRIVGDYAWEQYQVQIANRKLQNKEFITLEEFQKRKFDLVTEWRRKIEHFVARSAVKIIVPSRYLKGIVEQWGIPAAKIEVIYNALEPLVFTETKEDVRKKLTMHGTIIFSAGRLVPWKGFAALIDVVAELKKEIPDIKLYIAGDGPERKRLESRIMNQELGNAVFLVGRLSRDSLIEYVWAADVFVLNTAYEGFSHQLLEVMALGVPIVTTSAGGNPELIENQKTGLFVSYNDRQEIKKAIRLLIQNKKLYSRISQNAVKKSQEFSKERAIKEVIKLL